MRNGRAAAREINQTKEIVPIISSESFCFKSAGFSCLVLRFTLDGRSHQQAALKLETQGIVPFTGTPPTKDRNPRMLTLCR
jgi:hypothetical protein